jgi:hypothetical protein
MLMPKAAANLDHAAHPSEYNVRSTWKIGNMETITKAKPVQGSAHSEFWFRIRTSVPAHSCGDRRTGSYRRDRN